MTNAVLDVLTSRQFAAKEDYRLTLEALCKYPALAPDVFDAAEPVRMAFDRSRPDHVADTVWGWQQGPSSLIWKRRKPRAWGALYPNFSPAPKHGCVHFDANAEANTDKSDVINLFKDLSGVLEADFGFLEAKPPNRSSAWPPLSVTTLKLMKGLPGLYWATVFGPPYVRLFGRERLESIPAAVRTELAPDLFYVQLTDALDDVIERPESVDKARQAAWEHLGRDAFVIAPGAPMAARLPTFSFAAPQPTG